MTTVEFLCYFAVHHFWLFATNQNTTLVCHASVACPRSDRWAGVYYIRNLQVSGFLLSLEW